MLNSLYSYYLVPLVANRQLCVIGVKTCMECMEPIDEHKFEVATDVHGITDGPRLGRCRVIDRVNISCHFYVPHFLARITKKIF